jgi:hypothetical protein
MEVASSVSANVGTGPQLRFFGGGCGSGSGRTCRGENSPERFDAEEAMAAGVAAIGGKSEPALECDQCAGFDAFARNVFEIKVSAAGAVRVHRIGGRHFPRVEALLAFHAAPGPHARNIRDKVDHTSAVGPVTLNASTSRTNHQDPIQQQNCRKNLTRQDFAAYRKREGAASCPEIPRDDASCHYRNTVPYRIDFVS